MSKKSTKVNLADLTPEQTIQLTKKLAEKKAATKAAEKDQTWEAAKKERNPQFVVGSLRQPTEADITELGHCHGRVCTVVCVECGKGRTINTQDAHQVRHCRDCRKVAKRTASKAKRDAGQAQKTKESLTKLPVAELQALLGELKTEVASHQAA